MDNLEEECFGSLATIAVTDKDDLVGLLATNLALIKVVNNLANTNTHLVKKVES